jgi:hypothetical protein
VPVGTRVVEVVQPGRSVERLRSEIDAVRSIAAMPPSRFLRRVLFLWFRVYVRETKRGKSQRVNVRIPIPVPIVGALFPVGLSRAHALKALALAETAAQPADAVSDYLDSVMGFEFVRVDERKGDDHHELVVVGLD